MKFYKERYGTETKDNKFNKPYSKSKGKKNFDKKNYGKNATYNKQSDRAQKAPAKKSLWQKIKSFFGGNK